MEELNEIRKFAYFTFKHYGHGMQPEVMIKFIEFLGQFPEIAITPQVGGRYGLPYFWKVERNLIRKLKIKNLEEGLSESYKEFVRLMCNDEVVQFIGNTAPSFGSSGTSGTSGSTGTSGTSGSSGLDGNSISGSTIGDRGWKIKMEIETVKEKVQIKTVESEAPTIKMVEPPVTPKIEQFVNPFLELLEELTM